MDLHLTLKQDTARRAAEAILPYLGIDTTAGAPAAAPAQAR